MRKVGAPLGTRAEIKNVNSFKLLERAIMFEVERQIDIIEQADEQVKNIEKGGYILYIRSIALCRMKT